MRTGIKIRGIYATALTRLFLDAGYGIVDPSPEIQERFHLPPGSETLFRVLIRDRLDHQGVEILGEAQEISPIVQIIQAELLDAVLMDFASPAAWEDSLESEEMEDVQDWARARIEFPGTSKRILDSLRATVVPTLARHHRLRIIHPKRLEEAEKKLRASAAQKERLEREIFEETILLPLEKSGQVRVEHGKISGKPIRPREGVLVARREDRIVMKRSFTHGVYDGLNVPIEPGDDCLTEIQEGASFIKHTYWSRDGRLKGTYYNINTAVELYPYGARYMDLELDVIHRPGSPPFLEDREKLALLAQRGSIGRALEKWAVEVAEQIRERIQGQGVGGEAHGLKFKKILVVDNAIEAQLLDSVLTERNIPHRMRSYHDTAYDGIFQVQKGWGHVEAPPEYEEEIVALRGDLPLREEDRPPEDPGDSR
jgi:DNA-binding NarL/FixJ family response regulator